ncbi:hypothetical protein, partial [Peribacillus butanolivorans]
MNSSNNAIPPISEILYAKRTPTYKVDLLYVKESTFLLFLIELTHPLANHAAHDQRCTTENENGGKPSILILWL